MLREKKDRSGLLDVAVLGATGLVGEVFLKLLEERNFPVGRLYPFSSSGSAGKKITFRGKKIEVLDSRRAGEFEYDIAFFSAGKDIAIEYAPVFIKQGATVIDNSAAFRMDKNVPLIVPEVNWSAYRPAHRLIANPNCSTIQLVLVLAPLYRLSPIKRVVVSTYQSVSGTGKAALEELKLQSAAILAGKKVPEGKIYPHQIGFNCIPHIDRFEEDGYTFEEHKIMKETVKIMGARIPITATTVRVPVMRSHAESVNIEFSTDPGLEKIRKALSEMPGVVVMDEPSKNVYPTQVYAEGRGETFVGRIRKDPSRKKCYDLWVVSDNILKGAALNGIQIAEKLLMCE